MRLSSTFRASILIQPGWICGLTLLIQILTPAAESSEDFAAPIRPLLEEFCVRCHGGEETEAGIDLTGFRSHRQILEDRKLWRSVIEQIETEAMPPKKPFLTAGQMKEMTGWIHDSIENIDWSKHRTPGRVTLPRLTRTEYRNTLRDLLGVDLEAGADLPEDGEGPSGFVNDRDALSLSPSMLEHYFISAERALDGAFEIARNPRRWAFEAEEMQRNPAKLTPFRHGLMLVQPGHEIQAEVRFPVDGWYEFRVAAAVFGKPCVAEFRVDGEVVAEIAVDSASLQQSPVVRASGFVGRGIRPVTLQSKNLVPRIPLRPDAVRIVDERAKKLAPRLPKLSEDESRAVREAREALNHKAYGVQESYEWLREFGPDADSRKIDLRRVYLDERQAQWNGLRDRLAAAMGLGPAEVDRLWQKHNVERLEDNRRLLDAVAHVKWGDWMKYQGKLFVDRVEITGPVLPPVKANGWNLVEALKDETVSPLGLLEDFLTRAFRRPVAAEEIERHARMVRDGQRRGEDRESALQLALAAAMVSPQFLFRDEFGAEIPGGAIVPLDDFQLASRLSYFLWLSMPDDALFDLAASGELRKPGIPESLVSRMLNDSRSDSFFEAFALDWLGIRNLGSGIMPDPSRFPGFDEELAVAMREETVRFVAAVFREDLPLTDFIESRETFVNSRLAAHYGIDGVSGAEFRRVGLGDSHRGGLIGMGSILVATSSPARTNPVRRGAWVLERILGENPGEPLGDAGELPGNAGEARGKTLREELAIHSTRSECARCHDRIDPIGFGLQNFDATGRWRENEAGKPVDASGRLPDGREFSGPSELREVLMERRDDFLRNLTERMLAFALGRELKFYDEPVVEEIVAKVMAEENSAQALIREIVLSEPFRFRAAANPSE